MSSTIMMLLGMSFEFIRFKLTCGELFECIGHVSIKVRARYDGSEVDGMSRILLLQNLSSASPNNQLVFLSTCVLSHSAFAQRADLSIELSIDLMGLVGYAFVEASSSNISAAR